MVGSRRSARIAILVGVVALGAVAVLAGGGAATAPHDAFDADPLENETGTTEVVVRFTPIGEPDATGDAAVDELREHAADERAAFEAFAGRTEGVRIDRAFWLANAVLVTVDANETETVDLLSVANVTGVHGNVAIETHGGTGRRGGGIGDTEMSGVSGVDESHDDAVDEVHDGAVDEVHSGTVAQIDAEPAGRYTAGVALIGAPTAWERFGTRGAGATVAVIDTGVDPGHRDVDPDAWASFDANGTLESNDLADAGDPNGHGTHVAGTVAGGNASGTAIGVAPDATLHGIGAFDGNGSATFAGVVAAMEHATATGDADVLTMSLGATGTFRGFIAPVRNARAAGAVVVVAVGNEGANTSSSPANVRDSLAVGAVAPDENRTVAGFSSGQSINASAAFGEVPDDWPAMYVVPDVTAPGVGVVSAEAGTTNGYVRRQGTSMAAPHVAGVAALAVAATDGRADDDVVSAAIVDTAVHPAGAAQPDERYGYGVVDAPAAVGAAVEAVPPEPEPEPDPDENTSEPPDETTVGENDTPPEPEPEPTAGDPAPGFGVGVALVALLIGSIGVALAGEGRD